jgi:malate dehydrogenase (oxaloacetate-decarboxylating)(NADP+)
MSEDLNQAALDYHRFPQPGKLEIHATKPLANQRDLSLAYSPGVAAACKAIEDNPLAAAEYTARGNLVAVISNGTAVLGLGAIGALASKPVMEGKAVLFKKFADIDVFDIEIDELDPDKLIETIVRLEPSFGGINLEDIRAPECFQVEQALKQQMKIPIFHDDQHGTAIVVSAAVLNGLEVVGKSIESVRMVVAGAGAAALACLNLLVELGLKLANITVCDLVGVVHQGRVEAMDPYKARYAVDTHKRTLAEALQGADVFLGLSAAGAVQAEWLIDMAKRPLILALANPVPEVMPEAVLKVRPDAIMATGRTDYPNQVNNVLCFPFLFRGTLDCGATEINEAMKIAAVKAIANLAKAASSDVVRRAYGGQLLRFGPEYLIPKPFDPRLMEAIAPAVAEAAMASGVASRPIADLAAYRQTLHYRICRTGMTMKPVFDQAREAPKWVVYAEGEQDRVLQVAHQALELGIAKPVLIGNRAIIEERLKALSLRIRPGHDFELMDPRENSRCSRHTVTFYNRVKRRGYSPAEASEYIHLDYTVLAASMVRAGDADAMICGTIGRYLRHLKHVEEVIGLEPGVTRLTSLNAIVMRSGAIFIADTYVQEDPDAAALAEITFLCAKEIRRFGIEPKVALLSHSNFGSHDSASARKMRQTLELILARNPDFEVDGEMHSDLALSETIRTARLPESRLTGRANLLIMPNQDAANIAFNMLKTLSDGVVIGPILLGSAYSAHIVTPSVTVEALLNMTALAVAKTEA